MKKLLVLSGLCFILGMTGISSADTIVLDFEGIGDVTPVGDYYYDDYGVTFSDNAQAVVDSDVGGSGNIGGLPTPDAALFFLEGDAAVMNVEDGFDTGFSFYYSAISFAGLVEIYDDVEGGGNLLATFDLPLTPKNGAPDPTGIFSPFLAIGVEFEGIAKSIAFGGVINKIAFDNITFGSATAGGSGETSGTPEPATIFLLGSGLAGVAGLRKKMMK